MLWRTLVQHRREPEDAVGRGQVVRPRDVQRPREAADDAARGTQRVELAARVAEVDGGQDEHAQAQRRPRRQLHVRQRQRAKPWRRGRRRGRRRKGRPPWPPWPLCRRPLRPRRCHRLRRHRLHLRLLPPWVPQEVAEVVVGAVGAEDVAAVEAVA